MAHKLSIKGNLLTNGICYCWYIMKVKLIPHYVTSIVYSKWYICSLENSIALQDTTNLSCWFFTFWSVKISNVRRYWPGFLNYLGCLMCLWKQIVQILMRCHICVSLPGLALFLFFFILTLSMLDILCTTPPQLYPKLVSEYDQEIPQSQTADNPMAPRGRAVQQNIMQLQTPTMELQ